MLLNMQLSFIFMELIAVLGTGQGTWAQVAGLIKQGDWEKIILVGNEFAKKFSCEKPFEFIEIPAGSKLIELKQFLLKNLKDKIRGIEVALSIASGSGKEHMALISALLTIPAGVRFTALTGEGVVFL